MESSIHIACAFPPFRVLVLLDSCRDVAMSINSKCKVLGLTFLAFSRTTANCMRCGLLLLCCCCVPVAVSCALIYSLSYLPEMKDSFSGVYLPEELRFGPLAIRLLGDIWLQISFSGLQLPVLVV